MPSHIVDAGGFRELDFKELNTKEAAGLHVAGESVEIHPCKAILYETDKDPRTIIKVPTFADALPSLHFRACRNLGNSGYSIDDVAGYVVMSEKEVRELLCRRPGGLPGDLVSDKDWRVFGARYYLRKGHEKEGRQ